MAQNVQDRYSLQGIRKFSQLAARKILCLDNNQHSDGINIEASTSRSAGGWGQIVDGIESCGMKMVRY